MQTRHQMMMELKGKHMKRIAYNNRRDHHIDSNAIQLSKLYIWALPYPLTRGKERDLFTTLDIIYLMRVIPQPWILRGGWLTKIDQFAFIFQVSSVISPNKIHPSNRT